MNAKPRKRLFLGLLLGLELFMAAGLFILWYVPYRGFENLGGGLSRTTGWFFGGVLAVFTLAIAILVLTVIRGRELPGSRWLRGLLIRYLLPVITAIGGLFGVSKDSVRRSFIEINNELVRSAAFKAPPRRFLILMPHCIQKDTCPYRITVDVKNCRQCGLCDFMELTDIAEHLGIEMTVATGGTLARRVVIEVEPEIILAVACERDLSSGIADTYPIPVIGVLIDRPEGPCLNTKVSVQKVREALELFLPEEIYTGEIQPRKATVS